MSDELQKFLDNPHFAEFRDFLVSNPKRFVNSMPVWLTRSVPELNIAVVNSQNLESLVEQLDKKKHRLNVLAQSDIKEFVRKNKTDAIVVENLNDSLVNEVAIYSPIFYLNGETKNSTNAYRLLSPDYLSFFKEILKSKKLAPLQIISKEKSTGNNFARLMDSIGTYFSLQVSSPEDLKNQKIDQSSALIYLDGPEKGENGGVDSELLEILRDDSIKNPLIYVKPARFWRQHSLDELFKLGLFDFVSTNMGDYLLGNDPRDGERDKKLLVGLERITNSAHAAFMMLSCGFDKYDAFVQSRKNFPYIYFHAARKSSVDLMSEVVLSNSAITLHPHIGKEYQDLGDLSAIMESVQLAKNWKPNIIYIDLKPYAPLKVSDEYVKKFLEIRSMFPEAALILGYDSTKLSPSQLSFFLSQNESFFNKNLIELARYPVKPVIVNAANSAFGKFLDNRESTVSINISKLRNELLSKSKFILDKTVTDLESMLSSRLEIEEGAVSVYRGHPIYPGAASGKLFVDFDSAIEAKRKKEKVIFYVDDISQLTLNEVKEMRKFDGILFRRVAFENHQTIDLQRSGVPMMRVDDLKYNTKKEGFFAKKEITEYVLGHFSFTSEHPISINSATGQVYFGQNKVIPSQIVPTNLDIGKPEVKEYVSIMDTVDKVLSDMNLEIMINADNVEQILEARKWGASSIGLVRSENILRESETNLFSYGRLLHSLLTINKLWQDEEVVKKSGFPFDKKIEAVMKSFDSSQKEFGKVQEDAFYNILKTQNGKRTQIRLLDPSLSELFSESDVGKIIASTGVFYEPAKKVFYDALKDKSVRGVRLLVWPEIYEAQLNSLFNAYERVKKEGGAEPDLRIFIPYVDNYKQVERVKEMAEHIISQHHYGSAIKYEIGVTLETPGGCASAPEMIKRLHIKNFALGTNDLFPLIDGTGSRNEGSGTIASYVERAEDSTLLLSDGIIKLLSSTLDSMEAAAKEANLEYSLGICGEMNEVKLHNKNLGQYISRAQYVSAGRPQQIPILKFIIAQNYLKERMS